MSPEKRRIGVVADDITGSNDIGVMFAKNGYAVRVVSLSAKPCAADFEGTDVLVINTASRLDTAEDAAIKSTLAAKFLKDNGCRMIYTKTCSVFRGNIGASFDAVQDVMGVKTSMVVAGFPRNGRTTINGVHMLNGVPVAQTHFANDPVTPLKYSRLEELIHIQSRRVCAEFSADMYDMPYDAQKLLLDVLKMNASYVIFDIRNQEDLKCAAKLVNDSENICGSSALCEELPEAWGEKTSPAVYTAVSGEKTPCVILAGSLTPQTEAQVRLLEAKGTAAVVMDPVRLLTENERIRETERAMDALSKPLSSGKNALVYASRSTDDVRKLARKLNISDIETGRRISLAFARLASLIRARTTVKSFVVAGGETSDAVSSGLGVRSMRIWQEIEAGVPLMTAETSDGEIRLVLKSGSFGSEEFLYKAASIVTE